jgi:hypothetical protein
MSTVDPTVQGAEHPQNWLKALGPGLLFAAASVAELQGSELVLPANTSVVYAQNPAMTNTVFEPKIAPASARKGHWPANTPTSPIKKSRSKDYKRD